MCSHYNVNIKVPKIETYIEILIYSVFLLQNFSPPGRGRPKCDNGNFAGRPEAHAGAPGSGAAIDDQGHVVDSDGGMSTRKSMGRADKVHMKCRADKTASPMPEMPLR